jgi:hypothetical protein
MAARGGRALAARLAGGRIRRDASRVNGARCGSVAAGQWNTQLVELDAERGAA